MSQYIYFRKGETVLCSFSRSSYVYQSFDLAYTEDWKELTKEDFIAARSRVDEEIERVKEWNETLEKALEGLSYSDKLECLNDIRLAKEELRDITIASYYIQLLEEIAEEGTYEDNYAPMYYSIG